MTANFGWHVYEGLFTRNNAQAQAFSDNLVLPYAGISARELDARQRALLLAGVGAAAALLTQNWLLGVMGIVAIQVWRMWRRRAP